MRTVTFSHPFREGTAVSLAPAIATGVFDVGVAGRGYQLDLASNLFQIQSLPYMREQQDSGEQAGEGSLSNSSLWRRAMRSWHWGAGQIRGDERDSSPYRFDSSKGVNPWDEWELSLLNGTVLVSSLSNSPIGLAVAGSTMFLQGGTSIRTSTNGTSWTLATTLGSSPTCQPTSDGEVLYVGCADSTVKSVTAGGVVTDEWTFPEDPDVIGFAKGRLWVGAENALYQVTPGSAVTALFTHPWDGWRWTAICEGSAAVYAAGSLGDKTQVYRTAISSDGTGFDAATVAATLPDGEQVTALTSYLGFVAIGTTLGVRFAVPNAQGDLSYGALIPTDQPVLTFEAQDRFIWFGWSNYDGTSTGLGRMDLSQFTGDLVPAYASDLMHEGQGDVTSIVTFNGARYFTVEGDGAVGETSTPVAAGTLTASSWTFGLFDQKVASILSVIHDRLDGSVLLSLAVDGSGAAVVGESSVQGSTSPAEPFRLNPVRGVRHQVILTLVAGVAEGPTVTGVTFSAKPVPTRGKKFTLPLLLSRQPDLGGLLVHLSPEQEEEFLEGLVNEGTAVTVQIGTRNYQAFPVDFRFQPYRQSDEDRTWTGTFVLELDEVTT